MRSESISAAKAGLSALVKEVQAGEAVIITDRGVPVAQLVPVRMGKGLPPRAIGLAQQGLLRLPEHPPGTGWLRLPLPCATAGPSASELLIAERSEDR